MGKCSEGRARPRGRWASLWGPSWPPKSRLPHSSIRLPDGKPNSSEASSVTGTITHQTQARRFILAEHKCKEGALGEREGGEPGGGSRRGTWMEPRLCPVPGGSPPLRRIAPRRRLIQNKQSKQRVGKSGAPGAGRAQTERAGKASRRGRAEDPGKVGTGSLGSLPQK